MLALLLKLIAPPAVSSKLVGYYIEVFPRDFAKPTLPGIVLILYTFELTKESFTRGFTVLP